MERFVRDANIELHRRLIVDGERDPKRDEDRHAMLLILLTKEIAKDRNQDGRWLQPRERPPQALLAEGYLPKARPEAL